MAKRVSLGRHPNGTFGLRVSLPGFDVDTANDAQLAFSSDWADLDNVLAIGEYAVAPGSVAGVTHTMLDLTGIGYTPFAELFVRFDADMNNPADGIYKSLPPIFGNQFVWWESQQLVTRYTSTIQYGRFVTYIAYARPVPL